MTTTADLIERTKRHLYSGETRDERDRLSSGCTADAVGIGITFGATGIQAGAVLGIDLEELYVWDVAGTNLTVSRGENGSTGAAHAAAATIYVNPKFSAFAILQAINEELADLSAPGNGLYRQRTVSVPYNSGTEAYDLTSVGSLIDILEVTFDNDDGTERHMTLPRREWRLRRNMPTADFPSGLALTVNGYVRDGQSMNVAYKAPFATLSTIAQDVETVTGLPATAHDIVPLGAAIRLTAGAEVSRNFLEQGDTRRAGEVPAQARGSQMRMLMQLRDDRIQAERARLYAANPVMRV